MSQQQVSVFSPYPFAIGERLHIAAGPRRGDWQVIGISEGKVRLRCPVSGREVEWDRFCYLLQSNIQEWPQKG
ncbi:hypothetical protein ACUUL3_00845 [Thiovibrio sp. JS02]|jgi:hypothetical protein